MFFKEHKFILVNALAVAILVFLPNILFPFLAGDAYQGINSGNFESDEWQYMAHGREILDGHPPGNFLLKEGKDWYNAQQNYIQYLFMAPIKLFGFAGNVDVATAYHIWGFAGVFLLVILIYFFIFRLSGDKMLATLTAIFVVGGYNLIVRYPIDFSGFSLNINVYARPVRPVFSALALFLFFNLLIESLKSPRRIYILWSGAALGALFYVYFYAWTFAGAFMFVLAVIYLLRKDFAQTQKIVFIGLVGLLVGSYALLQMGLVAVSDVGRFILFVSGNKLSSAFVFSKIALAPLLLFAVFYYKNRRDKNAPFILGLILANWVVLNQQIVTGREMQPHHYFWFFVIPISILASLYMVWVLIGKEKYRTILCLFLILIVYVNMAIHQYRATFDTFDEKIYLQNYRPIIDYLNKDSAPGVILASDRLYQLLFIVYTTHDLFWSEGAVALNTPPRKITDALYVYSYLNSDSRNNFAAYHKYTDPSERKFKTRNYYKYDYGVAENYEFYANGQSRETIAANLEDGYLNVSQKNGGIVDLLKKYGVNYVVWDKKVNPEWDLSPLGGVKEVVSSNNIYLYRIEY